MDKQECKRRSLAAEAAGDEAKALYWSRREAGWDGYTHGRLFRVPAHHELRRPRARGLSMAHYGAVPHPQGLRTRKQAAAIVRNLLLPIGANVGNVEGLMTRVLTGVVHA